MYLQHFGLKEYPFSLTPDTHFFTRLPTHQEALNVLLVGLQTGEGFIKIVGEVGTGKTLLCRQLLELLDEDIITAYIPTPNLSPEELFLAVADEIGLCPDTMPKGHGLHKVLTERLIELFELDKRVVIIIDEAQSMPRESLEALRLLTNIETQKAKLLQVALFGQPELDIFLNRKEHRQLKQRITFSYTLSPLPTQSLDYYLNHRMSLAGYNGMPLFQGRVLKLIGQATHGIPRLVNIVSHKALMLAYGEGARTLKPSYVTQAIHDTEIALEYYKLSVKRPKRRIVTGLALLGIVGGFFAFRMMAA